MSELAAVILLEQTHKQVLQQASYCCKKP